MSIYIYTYPEELWFNNGGNSNLIKNGDLIKPKDVEYLTRRHPNRVVCIEKDIKEPKNDGIEDLKDLVKDQNRQIKDLIETIKSSSPQQTIIYSNQSEKSQIKPNAIDIKEPVFQPFLNNIETDNIRVSGNARDNSTIEKSDLKEKLKKLKQLKSK